MNIKKLLIIILTLVFTASPAFAKGSINDWVTQKAQSEKYGPKVFGTFTTGLLQLLAVPVELLYHPYHAIVHEKHYALGIFQGLGDGIIQSLQNVVYAAGNIGAAIVPGLGPFETSHTHRASEQTV